MPSERRHHETRPMFSRTAHVQTGVIWGVLISNLNSHSVREMREKLGGGKYFQLNHFWESVF